MPKTRNIGQAELQAHAFLGTPPPALADPDWPTKPGVRALKTKACCSRRTAYDEHKFKAFLKLCAEVRSRSGGMPGAPAVLEFAL